MKYSVGLQDPFAFNVKFWMILSLSLIGGAFLSMLIHHLVKNHRAKGTKKSFMTGKRLEWLKNKYLKHIDKIEEDYLSGRCDMRRTYQRMSHEVRKFTTRATGIKISTLVYSEIAQLHRPKLTDLIGNY